jgi:hypothetical protein
MSELGQTRPWGDVHCMTVLPPKAEVDLRSSYVADANSRHQSLAIRSPRRRGRAVTANHWTSVVLGVAAALMVTAGDVPGLAIKSK